MWNFVFYLCYGIFSVFVSVIDIKNGAISRLLLWGAIIFSILVQAVLYNDRVQILSAVLGCATGIGIFLLAFIFSGKKLGLADVWYSGVIGTIFGPLWWYFVMGITCVCAIAYFLVSKRRTIPFIPVMTLGSMAVFPAFLKYAIGGI